MLLDCNTRANPWLFAQFSFGSRLEIVPVMVAITLLGALLPELKVMLEPSPTSGVHWNLNPLL